MKKKVIKLDKALSLDKEIITRLNDEQLGSVEGGVLAGGTNSCNNGAVTSTPNSCQACSCNG